WWSAVHQWTDRGWAHVSVAERSDAGECGVPGGWRKPWRSAAGLRSASGPNGQFVELGQGAVPHHVGGLRQDHRDQVLSRIVEPCGAVAASPAVTTRNGRDLVWFGHDGHAVPPTVARQDRAGCGDLGWSQVIRRHQL